MRGASAESLERLTDVLGSALDGGADGMRVADDLFAVSGILRSQPSLRRVLTDVSVDADAKGRLVHEILDGKLDPVSVDLVARAAGMRWAATRHLYDALEHLGVVAVVDASERAGQADALENELFGYGQLVSGTPELRDALSDPARSVADRAGLVRTLLDGKVTPGALRLAEQSVSGSYRTVAVAVDAYSRTAAAHRRRLVGVVRVARPLTDTDKQRLTAVLSRQYSRPVHLNEVVDLALIGGIRVEIGDDVIDGTVASRLDDARRRLAG
jgi:F-type H+-transporting ATPase subunit delta